MIDEIELLRRYGKQTATTRSPNVDVTGRVMRTLRSQREERWSLSVPSLVTVAAASWAAVIGTGLLVQEAWSSLQDPVASLISPFVVAMQ